MRCAEHPDVETGLTCNKCGKPICPGCLVQAPVGMRCRQCARLTRLPTFQVSMADYARAVFIGLVAAFAGGILWLLIRSFIPFISFFNFFLAAGTGYGIGEIISRSANRKRGTVLRVTAAIYVLIAFVVGNQLSLSGHFILGFNLFNILSIAVAIYMAVSRV